MSKIYSVYNIMQRKAIFSNLENIQMICSWKLFLNIQYQYKTHVYICHWYSYSSIIYLIYIQPALWNLNISALIDDKYFLHRLRW